LFLITYYLTAIFTSFSGSPFLVPLVIFQPLQTNEITMYVFHVLFCVFYYILVATTSYYKRGIKVNLFVFVAALEYGGQRPIFVTEHFSYFSIVALKIFCLSLSVNKGTPFLNAPLYIIATM